MSDYENACEISGAIDDLRRATQVSLRDQFAAAALTGILSADNLKVSCFEYAVEAYAYADAMLKARGNHAPESFCRCGKPLPPTPSDDAPFEFCSIKCKKKYKR